MKTVSGRTAPRRVFGILLLIGAWGCMDEGTLYVEQPPWDNAFLEASSFLGYADAGSKATACGQCHPDVQLEWVQTGHADAWLGLQESGHAVAQCEACHSVTSLGNSVTNPQVGWLATGDHRFHDVQCESCHGPGLEHVSYPTVSKPLASLKAAVGGTNGCGQCHDGTHHPYTTQWAQSAHGLGPHTQEAGSRATCASCHEGRAALEVNFGTQSTFLERDGAELLTITCAVCHDPHGSGIDGQLRAPIDLPTRDNLCMQCHTRTGTPWSFRGPHAAQGLLVLAQDVGYLPPTSPIDFDIIPNPHGPANNERLCATCHVERRTVLDSGGNFLLESVGHTFEAVSCLDQEGRPVPGGDCSVAQRSFAGCTGAGCHGTEASARNAYLRVQTRLNYLLDQLWADINGNSILEATDGGLLPRLLAMGLDAELNPTSSALTPAKGAIWNAMLAWTDDRPHWGNGQVGGASFSAHRSSGNGVHNPHLLEALLLASIGDVRSAYGLR
jgi:predicted CXXCH cytochrome family protein